MKQDNNRIDQCPQCRYWRKYFSKFFSPSLWTTVSLSFICARVLLFKWFYRKFITDAFNLPANISVGFVVKRKTVSLTGIEGNTTFNNHPLLYAVFVAVVFNVQITQIIIYVSDNSEISRAQKRNTYIKNPPVQSEFA